MEDTKNNSENLDLSLTKEEVSLLVNVLKSVPLSGNIEQISALCSTLNNIIDRLNKLFE